jgi:hypothetical protein
VVERILDWVGGGAEIPALMDGFLTEFITTACGLDLSTVLRDYTLQLVTRYLSLLPLAMQQCCGSGSTGSTCFWASWIRIRIH